MTNLSDTLAALSDPVRLDCCPPGLFLFNGTLCFKSEYTSTLENPRRYQCDAYVVESGEYFWGGAKTTADRAKLLVHPIRTGQLVPVPSVEKLARAMAEQANDYDGDVLQWECWADSATAVIAVIAAMQEGRDG